MKRIVLMLALTVSTFFVASAHAGKLAEEKTMRRQLATVTNETNLVANYFPLILSHAGEEKEPVAIVMMFALANQTYISQLPSAPSFIKSTSKKLIDALVPKFIKAILPDNPDEAQEAINTWEQLNQ